MIGLSSLIVTNVKRNLARSLLTIVGMGLAALVMTTSLTLSEGYPAQAYAQYRSYLGGDIVIFRDKIQVRGADVNAATPGTWELQRSLTDLPGPAELFLPGLTTGGMIGPSGQSRGFFSTAEVRAVSSALSGIEGVSNVRPYFALPIGRVEFGLPVANAAGPVSIWPDAYLRAWPSDAPVNGLGAYVVAGRPLAQEDEGRRVCLIDASRAGLGALAGDAYPSSIPAVGEVIRVLLPRLTLTEQQSPSADYLAGRWVEFQVVGHYSVPTRQVSWVDPAAGGDGGAAPPQIEQLHLASPELLIPWATAAALVTDLSGGAADMWAQAVTVELASLARVETVTAAIASALPELCPVSVPGLVSIANERFLPEPIYRMPESEWGSATVPGQGGEPVRVSEAFSVILFAVAALLAAANGIVLVIERQREIAILKAVGAYARDVILMILGEIVLLASIGALGGFVLAEGLAAWNLISNRVGFVTIVVSIGTDLVKVLGVTVVFAVIFGLAPALRTTQMTAMEVLRRE